MREIKFRVWDKNYCHFLPMVDTLRIKDLNNQDDFLTQQFTGIKTRDGKEIYEGDIVQFIKPDYVGIVEFAGCQYLIRDLYEEGSYSYFGYLSVGIDYKILGNIYENPELLVKKEIENLELDKLCEDLKKFK